jgi:hypothetical protein
MTITKSLDGIQFSMRELLLLVLVAAMAIGWWVDHPRMARKLGNATFIRTIGPTDRTVRDD